MKFTVFLVAFALLALVQAEDPKDQENEQTKSGAFGKWKEIEQNFEKIREDVKNSMEKIKEGGEEAFQIATEMVEDLKQPCQDLKDFLEKGLIDKIPHMGKVTASIKEVCALVIDVGIPANAEELQKYIDAFKGF